MNMLNSIIIEGNVAEDAVLQNLATGGTLVVLKIDTERNFKNANGENVTEHTIFDVECYGALTKFVGTVKKGRGIRIVGRLHSKEWFDGNEVKHSKVYVIAEHLELKPMPR